MAYCALTVPCNCNGYVAYHDCKAESQPILNCGFSLIKQQVYVFWSLNTLSCSPQTQHRLVHPSTSLPRQLSTTLPITSIHMLVHPAHTHFPSLYAYPVNQPLTHISTGYSTPLLHPHLKMGAKKTQTSLMCTVMWSELRM